MPVSVESPKQFKSSESGLQNRPSPKGKHFDTFFFNSSQSLASAHVSAELAFLFWGSLSHFSCEDCHTSREVVAFDLLFVITCRHLTCRNSPQNPQGEFRVRGLHISSYVLERAQDWTPHWEETARRRMKTGCYWNQEMERERQTKAGAKQSQKTQTAGQHIFNCYMKPQKKELCAFFLTETLRNWKVKHRLGKNIWNKIWTYNRDEIPLSMHENS